MDTSRRRPTILGLLLVVLWGCGDSDPAAPEGEERAPPTYVSVTAGARHSCALDDAGRAYCWGFGGDGQLGLPAGTEAVTRPASLPTNLRFTSLAAGASHTCGVTGPGELFCWGTAPWGTAVAPERIDAGPAVSSVESRFGHVCAVTADGGAICLGRGESGQLGHGDHGDDAHAPAPVPVSGLDDVSRLAAGVTFTCALDGEGGPWCWGAHDAGALGMGDLEEGPCVSVDTPFPCSPVPAPVPGGGPLTDLVAGYYHVCGLATDGEVLCWGDQKEGQLGPIADPEICIWARPSDAVRSCRRTPRAVDIHGLLFRSLRAGGFHTCGLTESGEAHCWGANTFGQLGVLGDPGEGPGPVAGDLRWRDLALGQVHTCGVTVDGDAYCWGNGGWAQLGSGDEQASGPVEVLPPSG